MKRLLREFKRKKPMLYYHYKGSLECILLSRYDNNINQIAINDRYVYQMRDITFCLSDSNKSDFIARIEELGYKKDETLLERQLEIEGRKELFDSFAELEDWLMGDDDILF